MDVSVLYVRKEMRSLLKLTGWAGKRKQIVRGGGSVPVMGRGGEQQP